MTPKIDVCIATYKRPQLLKKLLLSLVDQKTAGEFTFTVIVADNDAQRSAEPVVRALNASGQKIIYAVEPQQNISLARNKALSFATGDYIATIDDDEHADPHWLLNLYRALTSHNADVVHGPVLPEFHPKTPHYIKAGFMRPNPPTGSTEKYVLNAGNTLFRSKLLEGLPTPFQPRFGRTGSEDSAFFYHLRRSGCRMIWCRESVVFERVSSKRANLVWLVKRKFRHGNIYPRYDDYFNPVAKIGAICLQLAALSGGILFFMIGGIFSSKYNDPCIECLLKVSFRLGILAHYANIHIGNRDDEDSE
jgi:succinoglycan biosynthesis protein ExoM